MRRAVALVLGIVAAYPALAMAVDQPINGAKLQLKQSSSGKQKLVFQSKDPSFPFPGIGGPDDPGTVGATIEVVSPGVATGSFVAPTNSVQPRQRRRRSRRDRRLHRARQPGSREAARAADF